MSSKPDTITAAPERETKRALGRGLSALIPQSSREPKPVPPQETAKTVEPENTNGLRLIPLVKIALNPYQPRQDFSAEQLAELAESIRQHGILQPIVVRPKGKTTFELVAGERRFRAATLAGLSEIPAIVKELDDRSSLAIALIENIQRQELNPVESARAYQRLLSEFHLTQVELAQEVGKSQPSIANSLRMLALPEPILDSLSSGAIAEGHAKVILSVDGDEARVALWKSVLSGSLSVRETERRASAIKASSIPRGITSPTAGSAAVDEIETARIEQELSLSLGTKVRIRYSGRDKGQIEVQFYALDQLDGLLQKLTGEISRG